jgi:uncharacterized protein
MKSLRAIVLVTIFVFTVSSVVLAAGKTVMPVYTPGAGGTAYLVGGATTAVINRYVPEVQLMVETTGGTAAMTKLMQEKSEKNQPSFGVPDSKVTLVAYKGEAPFSKPMLAQKAVVFTHGAGLNLVVETKSPIKSYADLKGKRVGVGAAGSGTAQMGMQLIEDHGVTSKMYKPLWLGYSEVVEGIKDGSIDAGFISGTYPVAAIQQLAFDTPIRVIPVDPDVLKKILPVSPWYYEFVLQPNAYKGITQPTSILVFGSFLSASDKVDTDLMYKMMHVLFDHRDELLAVCPGMKEMSLQNATKTIAIPFHPGTVKYYKEKGVMK